MFDTYNVYKQDTVYGITKCLNPYYHTTVNLDDFYFKSCIWIVDSTIAYPMNTTQQAL